MAKPILQIDQRMDRIELAVSTMAEKLELPEINSILAGEALEGASDEPALGGGTHYPAAEPEEDQIA